MESQSPPQLAPVTLLTAHLTAPRTQLTALLTAHQTALPVHQTPVTAPQSPQFQALKFLERTLAFCSTQASQGCKRWCANPTTPLVGRQ